MEEFSPATASVLGLPWDCHERCRASLEADYLQPMYLHARNVARESVPAALAGQDGGTCQACLLLMCTILSWEFRCAIPARAITRQWIFYMQVQVFLLILIAICQSGTPVFSGRQSRCDPPSRSSCLVECN